MHDRGSNCRSRGDRHPLCRGGEAEPLYDAATDARDDRLVDCRGAYPRLNGAKRQRRLGARRRKNGAIFAVEPALAKAAHVLDHRQQRATLVGQRILGPWRQLGELLALNNSLLLKLAQAQRKRARADPRQRALKLTEARAALIELTDNKQRPLGADDVSSPTDGAFGINSHPSTLPSEVTS